MEGQFVRWDAIQKILDTAMAEQSQAPLNLQPRERKDSTAVLDAATKVAGQLIDLGWSTNRSQDRLQLNNHLGV